MRINMNEASTVRGLVSAAVVIVCFLAIANGVTVETVTSILVLAKGVDAYMKVTLPDKLAAKGAGAGEEPKT